MCMLRQVCPSLLPLRDLVVPIEPGTQDAALAHSYPDHNSYFEMVAEQLRPLALMPCWLPFLCDESSCEIVFDEFFGEAIWAQHPVKCCRKTELEERHCSGGNSKTWWRSVTVAVTLVRQCWGAPLLRWHW